MKTVASLFFKEINNKSLDFSSQSSSDI